MKQNNILLILAFMSFWVNAQETIIQSGFAIRDFAIHKDSIYFIEKRDIKYKNYRTENKSPKEYFIGGYGVKIFNDSLNKEVISISNEFEQTVSSLRFYNKSSQKVDDVFYYKKGKTINALFALESKHVIMSMSNNKIIVVNYSAKPVFEIIHEIPLKSLARGLFYTKNSLFYATDLGNVYKYDLKTKKNKLIYSYGEIITDLKFYNQNLIFTTEKGKIIKYDTINKTELKLQIKNNFILNTLLFEDKLICGTFKGSIMVVDLKEMRLVNQLNYHNRSILKIVKGEQEEFYSSSIDKTLKKWKLEKNLKVLN